MISTKSQWIGVNGRCRPFTLIELLVVTVIILILASMLLPSLSRAKETAKIAVCQGNEKELAAAVHLYEADYDSHWGKRQSVAGMGFPADPDGQSDWAGNYTVYSEVDHGANNAWVKDEAYGGYLTIDQNNIGTTTSYGARDESPIHDPGARMQRTILVQQAWGGNYPSDSWRQRWQGEYPYLVREFLHTDAGTYDRYVNPRSYSRSHAAPDRARITHCPVGADAWQWGFSQANHMMDVGGELNIEYFSGGRRVYLSPWWFGSNVAFGDGHVRFVRSTDVNQGDMEAEWWHTWHGADFSFTISVWAEEY